VLAYDVSAAPRVVARIAPGAGQTGFSVSSGRFDTDAIDDIILASARGGGGVTEVYAGRTAAAGGAARLAQFAAFNGLAKRNAPVFTAGVDSDGDGRIDRFLATQGDAGGSAGVVRTSAAGARVAAFSTVTGPLRIAAARTWFREVTTNTGLKYRDIIVGQGATPTTGQRLTVNYIGRLADGTVFDSSIAGWDEGLATTKVGGWRKLVIRPELGYGSVPNGNIPANSTLYFDVELLAIG
jgi:hypothetical protein